jgi:hypothetical protein
MAVSVFSQKDIPKEEYYQPFRESMKKAHDTSRRVVQQSKYYKNGALTGEVEYIYERQLPDKTRYVYISQSDGKTRKVEVIEIGSDYYCRKNDGEWTQSRKSCGIAGGGIGGPSDVLSSKFTVNNVKTDSGKAKLYTSYLTYKNTYSAHPDKESVFYWDNKFWLNKDGFVIREEFKRGLLNPLYVEAEESKTYEYKPNITIEAPIKQP